MEPPPRPITRPGPWEQSFASLLSSPLALLLITLTVCAVVVLSCTESRNGCRITITGHSTHIEGDCPITVELIKAAHPAGVKFRQPSKSLTEHQDEFV
uniref:Movement protein TGBp3 n=1 Tax=Sutera flower mottle virus TaxID=2931829 RepID=A0A8T9JC12_9VIRU|nr:triple gene block 3 protein [Sutera flower mottle virus]